MCVCAVCESLTVVYLSTQTLNGFLILTLHFHPNLPVQGVKARHVTQRRLLLSGECTYAEERRRRRFIWCLFYFQAWMAPPAIVQPAHNATLLPVLPSRLFFCWFRLLGARLDGRALMPPLDRRQAPHAGWEGWSSSAVAGLRPLTLFRQIRTR